MTNSKKIGIYSGTFDPVHEGHISFAEEALKRCGLDKVFFLAEPRPRRKQGVRALEHREAMLTLAVKDNPRLGMIRLEQAHFSVEGTLPKLQARFEGAQMHFMMGEDVFAHLNSWPHVEDLLRNSRFIVGIREGDESQVRDVLHGIQKARGIRFAAELLVTQQHEVASTKIRLAYKRGRQPKGVTPEVGEYIEANKLYAASEE